jgi:hypothetical protein
MDGRTARRGRPPIETVFIRSDPSGDFAGRRLPFRDFKKSLDDGFFDEGTRVVIFNRRALVIGKQLRPQAILFEERRA